MGLAENLRAYRKARGLTLDDLAAMSGVGRSVIGAIETRAQKASDHQLPLARALSIPICALLSDEAPDPVSGLTPGCSFQPARGVQSMQEAWPFELDFHRWERLTERQKGRVEKALIDEISRIEAEGGRFGNEAAA
jgi:transcriptional regulator with XRE-family HTH domain